MTRAGSSRPDDPDMRSGYGQATFASYELGRRYVRPVNSEIVRWVLDTYAKDAEWLLEPGSGLGELAMLLPDGIRGKLVQVDALPELLSRNSHMTAKVAADARVLPFPDKVVPALVSYSFLNAVTDVEEVLQEASRVLRPGGAFLSILDVQAVPELVMTRFPSDILLPAAMPVSSTGVIVTDRRYLRTDRSGLQKALVQSLVQVKRQVRDFLDLYLSAPVPTWHFFQTEGSHVDRIELAYAVAEAVSSLGLASNTLDSLQFFERVAQAACWETGLHVLQSELVTGHGEVDRSEVPGFSPKRNVALAYLGARWEDTDPGVQEGTVHLASTVHVLAAEKPLTARR